MMIAKRAQLPPRNGKLRAGGRGQLGVIQPALVRDEHHRRPQRRAGRLEDDLVAQRRELRAEPVDLCFF